MHATLGSRDAAGVHSRWLQMQAIPYMDGRHVVDSGTRAGIKDTEVTELKRW
jgi:hypothetical protein